MGLFVASHLRMTPRVKWSFVFRVVTELRIPEVYVSLKLFNHIGTAEVVVFGAVVFTGADTAEDEQFRGFIFLPGYPFGFRQKAFPKPFMLGR